MGAISAGCDLGDEAKPAARDGPDKTLRCAVVADRAARRVYPTGERSVRDDPSVPNRLENLILADHAIAVGSQIDQKVEYLGLHMDSAPAEPELATGRVEFAALEPDDHPQAR
jgi:hypothetical protein